LGIADVGGFLLHHAVDFLEEGKVHRVNGVEGLAISSRAPKPLATG
jgi:hypothetical protein